MNNVDLHLLAEGMGIKLVRHTGGEKGYYLHRLRAISTRRGLSIAQYKSTLAHELAHAHYGDEARHGIYAPRMERRADQWAAHLLLDHEDVGEALTWHSGHLDPAAKDLEVTRHLLEIWLKDHERQAA